mmetsp:Transcript_19243/g.40237  ORF Transcript_19243/g.40237 Transcript_19243/m.40237 type:complete len:117 (+) Transcript_19243:1445-1795(+)
MTWFRRDFVDLWRPCLRSKAKALPPATAVPRPDLKVFASPVFEYLSAKTCRLFPCVKSFCSCTGCVTNVGELDWRWSKAHAPATDERATTSFFEMPLLDGEAIPAWSAPANTEIGR